MILVLSSLVSAGSKRLTSVRCAYYITSLNYPLDVLDFSRKLLTKKGGHLLYLADGVAVDVFVVHVQAHPLCYVFLGHPFGDGELIELQGGKVVSKPPPVPAFLQNEEGLIGALGDVNVVVVGVFAALGNGVGDKRGNRVRFCSL